jgi:fucokinase
MLKTKVCSIDLDDSVCKELNKRLVLVFSGKQRLAKNILTNVLRRWARRSSDIVETVQQLVQGAYESQKKVMAGPESGVEPCFVKSLLDLLHSKGCIVGGTLCFAGGEH